MIGSGGREHALAWALSRSPSAEKVFVAPGNPGTRAVACNVPLDWSKAGGVVQFCLKERVDLVAVGPENPLAQGIGDILRRHGIAAFGPGKHGAMLESSKSYAKRFMRKHGIPHPRFEVFDHADSALEFVRETPGPWVIKADGLAMGKGVSILEDQAQALEMIPRIMDGMVYGEAGKKIVIEEYLEGREVSAMALTDGKTLLMLPLAVDHKRVGDGDSGPMTGGMGAFSPVPFISPETKQKIAQDILEATLKGLILEEIDFRGLIYAGLMLTDDGPKVLEYNVRFGDPETQCVLPRLKGDLAGALMDCARGDLGICRESSIEIRPDACVTVVLASGGYPGEYQKGLQIRGLDRSDHAFEKDGVCVFHAGTNEGSACEGSLGDNPLLTGGGRVLAVSALADTLGQARAKVYRAVRGITFEGVYYRTDIAAGV